MIVSLLSVAVFASKWFGATSAWSDLLASVVCLYLFVRYVRPRRGFFWQHAPVLLVLLLTNQMSFAHATPATTTLAALALVLSVLLDVFFSPDCASLPRPRGPFAGRFVFRRSVSSGTGRTLSLSFDSTGLPSPRHARVSRRTQLAPRTQCLARRIRTFACFIQVGAFALLLPSFVIAPNAASLVQRKSIAAPIDVWRRATCRRTLRTCAAWPSLSTCPSFSSGT